MHSHPQCLLAHCARLSNYAQIKPGPQNISLFKVFLQGSFTPNWIPDGHQLCENVVYDNKRLCSEKAVKTGFIWFLQVNSCAAQVGLLSGQVHPRNFL